MSGDRHARGLGKLSQRKGRRQGLYRVKLGRRWTIAEHIVPDDEVDAYWIVIGSAEWFTASEFAVIGNRVVHLF